MVRGSDSSCSGVDRDPTILLRTVGFFFLIILTDRKILSRLDLMIFNIRRFQGKFKFSNFRINLRRFHKIFIFVFVGIVVLYVVAWLGYDSGFRNAKSERIIYPEEDEKIEVSWEELLRSDIDTTAWKTFDDELYGYSIKYPENWYLLEENLEIESALISDVPDPSPHYYKENESGRLSIYRSSSEGCQTFLECVKNENSFLIDDYYFKFIRFGSISALFGFSDLDLGNEESANVVLFVDYQDYFLEFIGYTKSGDKYYENLETVLGMLKSLEFVDQENLEKSFTDSEFGYSIKYPQSWYAHELSEEEDFGYSLILSDAPGNTSHQSRTPDEHARILITRDVNPEGKTLVEWSDNTFFNKGSKEKIEIGDNTAIRISFPSREGNGKEWVILKQGDWIYNLHGIVSDGLDYHHNKKLTWKMQNSFRFFD